MFAKRSYRAVDRRTLLAFALWVVVAGVPLRAQKGTDPTDDSSPMTIRLRTLLNPVGVVVGDGAAEAVAASEQIHLRWEKTPLVRRHQDIAASFQVRGSVKVVARVSNRGPLPRHRTLGLAADRLLVVGVGADLRLRNWTVIPDPRIIRAEIPGPDGTLRGSVVLRQQADFFVDLHSADGVAELRFYKPVWNGKDFYLVPAGTVSIK